MKLLIGPNPCTYSCICRIVRVAAYSTKIIIPNSDTLNIRITRSGNPKASIVPVLNQWLQEGKPINQSMLQTIVRQLRSFRRYNHALQVSEYMSEEMKYGISVAEMAVRLDLISKVRGLDQAQKYFDSLPDTMRNFQVYGALLNCYAHHKCLEKAESTLQIMTKLGVPMKTVSYNVMLNLYRCLREHDKLDALMQEMKEKGVKHDAYTNNIRLNAYASSSDIEGMEKFLTKVENEELSMCWNGYFVVANAYLKAKLTDKALQMLDRAEQLVTRESKKHAYEAFLTTYANLGRKDEVYRIWKLYGNLGKFFNSGYLCMISSLVKLDDLDGAEKLLREWESGYPFYDSRIPTIMIGAYCKRGFTEKAEACINRLLERGAIKEPDAFVLNNLATGYQLEGQMDKAVEITKAAILSSSSGWKPNIGTLTACLKYLEEENKLEAAKELLELLKVGCHLPNDVYDRLARNIIDRNMDVSVLDLVKGASETLGEESTRTDGGQTELAADLELPK